MNLLISPCPNDTFIFHAMLHGLVDCHGLSFEPHYMDIDQLNQEAITGRGDLIKVSIAVLPLLKGYTLLESGGAMGYGNGPLLVSRRKIYPDELSHCRIAIPGHQTTAAALMAKIYPQATQLTSYLFSDIATVVMDDEMDAGVLIHEGRFTYKNIGLRLVADLGHEWQQLTQSPIPLGGIVASDRLSKSEQQLIQRIIRHSASYAMNNPEASQDFVRDHARELSPEVLANHISYFVNDFTLNISEKGRLAIDNLIGKENYKIVPE